jgi:hypothetical protein
MVTLGIGHWRVTSSPWREEGEHPCGSPVEGQGLTTEGGRGGS